MTIKPCIIIQLIIFSSIIFLLFQLLKQENFALPFQNFQQMINARLTPSRCTDGCIIRTRTGNYIDDQCSNMCKNWYPLTYDKASSYTIGYAGYPQYNSNGKFIGPSYTQNLEYSLNNDQSLYRFGNI